MDNRVVKARFREPRFIRKEGKYELDETPLLVGNLRFGNKHFLAGEEEERGWSAKAMATSRNRMGAFFGGYSQRSCPSARLPAPPMHVAARKSRAVVQFLNLGLITLCSSQLPPKPCHISTEYMRNQRFCSDETTLL